MPLLPTAGGAARPPVQQRLARRPARLLLLALLAVCVVKAAWNSQSLLCAWRRGGGDQRSLASEPIVAVQLQQEAAPAPRTSGSAAGANETASGSGSSNRTVVLGSGKSKAAGTASSTASKAAGITGSIASQAAASAGNASRPAVSWAWEERPDGQPPPAELPLPIVEAASNVSCAQVGRRFGCTAKPSICRPLKSANLKPPLMCCLMACLPPCSAGWLRSDGFSASLLDQPLPPPAPYTGPGSAQGCPAVLDSRPNASRRDVAPVVCLGCWHAANPQHAGKRGGIESWEAWQGWCQWRGRGQLVVCIPCGLNAGLVEACVAPFSC